MKKEHLRINGGGLVAKSCPTLAILRTVTHQAPLSMGFPRQAYWSGLLFPSSRDLLHPGIAPESPALQDSLLTEPPGKPPESMKYSVKHKINTCIQI